MLPPESQEDLLERLRKLEGLTPGQAKIADFFQRFYPQLVFESVTSISHKTGLSKATVVRFISRLGYGSFAEFRDQLRQETVCRLDSPRDRYSLSKAELVEGPSGCLGQNITAVMRNLQEAHARIGPERFLEAARLLALGEGALYVMGQMNSYGMAHLFWSMASYLRERVYLLDNQASALPNRLVDVTAKDVLLAITRRRYALQTSLTVNHFAQRGGKVVLLCDGEVTPISHLADLILVAPTGGILMFDSACAPLAVIEALVAAMANLLEDKIYDRLASLDGLLNEFGTFSSSPPAPSRKGEVQPEKSKLFTGPKKGAWP